jgi:hypothetical protein
MLEGTEVASVPVVVVVPKSIGDDHEKKITRKVDPINLVGNNKSRPSFSVALGDVQLVTIYGIDLNVPVLDQFRKPLSGIYGGQMVEEKFSIAGDWVDINSPLGNTGHYTDFVGMSFPANPASIPENNEEVKAWPKAKSNPPDSTTVTQNISVRVAGHELANGINNRVVKSQKPNIITIIWD